MLQRNPDLAATLNFQYDVNATIRLGRVVTAYSRKYRILQRGVVLSYDDRKARYLVQFESKEFGNEFCPDSEVASHGIPELLIPAPDRTLTGSNDKNCGYYISGDPSQPLVGTTSVSGIRKYCVSYMLCSVHGAH
jgi:hypothetical protein